MITYQWTCSRNWEIVDWPVLVNKIYISGDWPKDFLDVTMIKLLKKNQAKKCSDHRTINLISHTGKAVAYILSKRLESKIEEVIGEDQFRLWKGKGTRDAIGLMRIISESVLDVKEKECLCFIDCKKRLLTVLNGPKCWKCLEISELTGANVD